MSISSVSTHSAIWNSAASALTRAPQPGSTLHPKPNQADTPAAQGPGSLGSSNLLDTLSTTSQTALIQLQAQSQRGLSV